MFKLKLSKTVLLLAVLTLQYEQKTTGFRKKKNENQGAVQWCFVTKQVQRSKSAFISFLKLWMLGVKSGFCLQLFLCNILQIFIFGHIYFLAKDAFFLFSH